MPSLGVDSIASQDAMLYNSKIGEIYFGGLTVDPWNSGINHE
jgi:hypothetical protein